jgi:DNA polymerase-3 subunit epsilon
MTMNWLLFDLETTGVDTEEARIVTACTAHVTETAKPVINEWLVNPGIDIPQQATDVHGITTAHAKKHGQRPDEAIHDIAEAIVNATRQGIPIVAMNATYDLTVLDRELRRNGLDRLPIIRPVLDPMVIDREKDKYRKGKRTLIALCEHYTVRIDGAHNSTADAIAAGRVLWAQYRKYPELAALADDELHDLQVTWHAARQTDFAAYLAKQGKPADDVSGEWPIRHLREAVNA